MALTLRKSLLQKLSPFLQAKRYRGKINIQKPKPPHFERAKYIALTKPIFISPYKDKSAIELCKGVNEKRTKGEEDNTFQRIIARELLDRFKSSKLIAFYHVNPVNAYQQFKAYAMFKKQNIFFKNYGKKTLEMAIKGTSYEPILDYYVSRNMMAFSPEANLKQLLRITKRFPQYILLFAVFEGRLINKDEILYYSTIPNLQSARVSLVQTLDSIGSQFVNHLNCHQATLVSQLEERMKQLQENK